MSCKNIYINIGCCDCCGSNCNGGDGNGHGHGSGNGGGNGNGNGSCSCDCDCDCNGNGSDGDNGPGKSNITLLGGTSTDIFYGLIPVADGYIVCGSTSSVGAGGDALLVKFDNNLNLISKTTLGGSKNDAFSAITLSKNGASYLTAGWTQDSGSHYFTTAFDQDIKVIEQRKVAGGAYDVLYSICSTPEGFQGSASYVATGYTSSPNGQKYAQPSVITYDKDHNILRQVCIGNLSEGFFYGVAANKEGFVAVGYAAALSGAGSYDALIVSFDENLNPVKKILIGSTGDDRLMSIKSTADGYVIGGYTNSFGFGNYDILIMTLDNDLNILKNIVIGGSSSDTLSSVVVAPNGNYVLTGNTSSVGAGGSDAFLIVLDKSLDIIKQLVFGGSGNETSSAVAIGSDGSYVLAGSTPSVGAGNADCFIASFNGDFSDLTGNLAKYPALRIDGAPGFKSKSDFNFTVNANTTLTIATTTLAMTNPNFTLNTSPNLIIDANAMTVI